MINITIIREMKRNYMLPIILFKPKIFICNYVFAPLITCLVT